MEENGEAVLRVRDNGIGISAEMLRALRPPSASPTGRWRDRRAASASDSRSEPARRVAW